MYVTATISSQLTLSSLAGACFIPAHQRGDTLLHIVASGRAPIGAPDAGAEPASPGAPAATASAAGGARIGGPFAPSGQLQRQQQRAGGSGTAPLQPQRSSRVTKSDADALEETGAEDDSGSVACARAALDAGADTESVNAVRTRTDTDTSSHQL